MAAAALLAPVRGELERLYDVERQLRAATLRSVSLQGLIGKEWDAVSVAVGLLKQREEELLRRPVVTKEKQAKQAKQAKQVKASKKRSDNDDSDDNDNGGGGGGSKATAEESDDRDEDNKCKASAPPKRAKKFSPLPAADTALVLFDGAVMMAQPSPPHPPYDVTAKIMEMIDSACVQLDRDIIRGGHIEASLLVQHSVHPLELGQRTLDEVIFDLAKAERKKCLNALDTNVLRGLCDGGTKFVVNGVTRYATTCLPSDLCEYLAHSWSSSSGGVVISVHGSAIPSEADVQRAYECVGLKECLERMQAVEAHASYGEWWRAGVLAAFSYSTF